MFVDIHGHSRSKNLFMFGCTNNDNPKDVMKERIFPLLLHKNCESFYFDSCAFDVHPDKASTGRITLREEFGIINSFTFEVGICGASVGKYKGHHFTIS